MPRHSPSSGHRAEAGDNAGLGQHSGVTVFPLVCMMLSFLVVRIPTASLLKGPLDLDGIIWAVPIGWFVGLASIAFAVRRYIQDARRFIPVQSNSV
ncbi:hypothetical protein AB0D11_44140 [Streptomyces monashensis]|uniref:hypothetical protein n=1 Tax=Streptomyces monashensis TaxID=1678012 RepID=UPI003406319C